MTRNKTYFGSETRAVDGCIVTFRMPDGSDHVERFTTLLHSQPEMRINGRGYGWKTKRVGPTYVEQAVSWADEHEARIICMSTPETILRDLGGARVEFEARFDQNARNGQVRYPERSMLGNFGRVDLFLEPGSERTPRGRIREDVETTRETAAS